MNAVTRRSFFAVGLGLVAGCSSSRTVSTRAGAPSDEVAIGDLPLPVLGGEQPITSIAMVGDSITEASTSELAAAFAALGVTDVVIDGESSRRIDVASNRDGPGVSGVNAVKAILESGADSSLWVIALGTNDVGGFGSRDECRDLIELITDLLPAPVPLVWVNVYRPSDLEQSRMFNDVLAGLLADRGNAAIADWFTVASDPAQDVLRSDELHPNDAGKAAFAAAVVQAFQRL